MLQATEQGIREPQGRTQAAKEAIQVSGGSRESRPSGPESNPKKTTLDLTEGRVPQMVVEGESQEEGGILGQPIQVDQAAPWPKRAGRLTCSKDAINYHLKVTYSDSIREQPQGPCDALITPPEPSSDFDLKEPRLREVEYKNCQSYLAWRYAEGMCIPKEEKSENIDHFQVISLLSVESKIFFSIVAKSTESLFQLPERSHPGLLQQVQLESLYWPANI